MSTITDALLIELLVEKHASDKDYIESLVKQIESMQSEGKVHDLQAKVLELQRRNDNQRDAVEKLDGVVQDREATIERLEEHIESLPHLEGVSLETLQLVLNLAWGSGGHQHTRFTHALQERLDVAGITVNVGT